VGLRDELLEQPEAARRQLASDPAPIEALAGRLRSDPVDSVVIAARGSSDHAAIYAQYVFGVRHRLPVALAAPSITSIYGVEPRFERALVIAISQSGASPDVVGVLAAARRQGAPTLAITNDPASPLAAAAEFVIDLMAGPEKAVAATKTYTASLLAIARLSAALVETGIGGTEGGTPAIAAGLRGSATDLAAVPTHLAAAVAAPVEDDVKRAVGPLAAADRCVILGRGFEYATAREWALKLKELARVFADPYSAADFEHGPLALIGPGVPVLAVVPSGLAAEGLEELLQRLGANGADITILSDDPATRAIGARSIGLPPGIPEWLRPIVSIVPAQLFAYHLTRARGLDPESPRNLSKVTRTR
jgi:glucosamine--fructose-6-phosphate aminotransferase (isomerizing)